MLLTERANPSSTRLALRRKRFGKMWGELTDLPSFAKLQLPHGFQLDISRCLRRSVEFRLNPFGSWRRPLLPANLLRYLPQQFDRRQKPRSIHSAVRKPTYVLGKFTGIEA